MQRWRMVQRPSEEWSTKRVNHALEAPLDRKQSKNASIADVIDTLGRSHSCETLIAEESIIPSVLVGSTRFSSCSGDVGNGSHRKNLL
jgi:hypothetical protein